MTSNGVNITWFNCARSLWMMERGMFKKIWFLKWSPSSHRPKETPDITEPSLCLNFGKEAIAQQPSTLGPSRPRFAKYDQWIPGTRRNPSKTLTHSSSFYWKPLLAFKGCKEPFSPHFPTHHSLFSTQEGKMWWHWSSCPFSGGFLIKTGERRMGWEALQHTFICILPSPWSM